MILVTLSIFLAVSSIGITNRKPSTHSMSPWVKRVFTDILPSVLRMERPGFKKSKSSVVGGLIHCMKKDYHCSLHLLNINDEPKKKSQEFLEYPKRVQSAVNGVQFIADNLRKSDEVKMVSNLHLEIKQIVQFISIWLNVCWYLIWFFLVGRKSWIGSTSLWWWTACFSISSRRLVSVELLPYFYTPPLCMTRVMHLRWMTSLKSVCINVILLEYAYIWVRTKDKHKS